MKKIVVPTTTLAIFIAIFLIFFPPRKLHEPAPAPKTLATPPAAKTPPARYPLAEPAAPAEPDGEQTPAAATEASPTSAPSDTDEVDEALRQLLDLLGGKGPLGKLFILDHFIQRFVVTVDNLPNKDLPRKQLPVKNAEGRFTIQTSEAGDVIAPANAKRYTPFVELAEALDRRQLVDLYVRLYPLFQKAYDDLGKPRGYFNDRLIEVIDHLLATPPPRQPILLARPAVLYKYADPDLEARSAGQKILLRIGGDNAERLKAKLRELRAELISRSSGDKPATNQEKNPASRPVKPS